MRYHSAMTDDRKPARRPFGERDEEERRRPFGASRRAGDRPERPPEPARRDRTDDPQDDPPGESTRFNRPSGASSPERRTTSPFDDEPAPTGNGGYHPLEDYYTDQREPEPFVRPDLEAPDDEDDDLGGFMDVLPEDAEEPIPAPGAAAPPRKPPERPPLNFWVMARTIGLVLLVAAGVASVFTWWTPNAFLPAASMDQLSVALATQSSLVVPPPPTATPGPTPNVTATPAEPVIPRIGIVAGHYGMHPSTGEPDPGAVCNDGLTEAEINLSIAELVVEWLDGHGYQVDLLEEFDSRLANYQASALVSIHADSCEYINDAATGFKVASFAETSSPQEDAHLVACLSDRYAATTGLAPHNSVTFDMTQYHNFREVAPGTPGAIIEVGFLYMDRDLLTESPDVVALGVARGILCYLRDEPLTTEAQPTPTAEADAP